jgi:CBS domain-containing protein
MEMSEKFITVDQSEPVSQAINKMESGICVMDGKRFLGIFDPYALLKVRMDAAELKIAHATKQVPKLKADDDLAVVVRHFLESGMRMLPVMQKDLLIGVVYDTMLLKQMKDLVGSMRVQQLSHPRPIVLQETDRVDAAFLIMREEGIDHIPIVGENGKAIGMVSITDLLKNYSSHHIERDHGQAPKSRTRAFRAELPDLAALPIGNFMHHGDVHAIGEQELVSVAIDRMLQHRVHSLLIVDDEVPMGMMTSRDIFNVFVHQGTPEEQNIQYVGLEELALESYEKGLVRRTVSHYAAKLQHYFDKGFQLMVHIKEHSKTGSRHRYTAQLRIAYPGDTIPSIDSESWSVRSAVQEACKRMETHLSHMYRENKKEVLSERKVGRAMPGEAL